MASTWLLRQGYEVFRNVSPHGIADMVAWKPGEPPIMVEVRKLSLHVAKDGKSCSVGGRRTYGPGVFVLHVDTETGKCGFDLEALVAGLGYRLRPSRTYTLFCNVAGCKAKHSARGLCNKHYEHWRLQLSNWESLAARPKGVEANGHLTQGSEHDGGDDHLSPPD
jgi:hypothetical protein